MALFGLAALASVAGIGLQAFGAFQSSKAAKASAQAQANIAAQEQQAEAVRMKAMELDARRRRLEMIRNQQRATAISVATATAQGASAPDSSAIPGAYGQHFGQTGVNVNGVNQNLLLGREMFGINSAISQQRIAMAQYSGQAASARGLASLGSSLLSVTPQISALSQGVFPDNRQGYWYGGYGNVGSMNYGYRPPENYGNYTY